MLVTLYISAIVCSFMLGRLTNFAQMDKIENLKTRLRTAEDANEYWMQNYTDEFDQNTKLMEQIKRMRDESN